MDSKWNLALPAPTQKTDSTWSAEGRWKTSIQNLGDEGRAVEADEQDEDGGAGEKMKDGTQAVNPRDEGRVVKAEEQDVDGRAGGEAKDVNTEGSSVRGQDR